MRILLVGHGKMGRLVESLAPEYGCEVAGVVDPESPAHAAVRSTIRGGAASTWRSISRRRMPSPTTCRRSPGAASTSSSARPAGSAHEAALRQAVAEAGSRHRRRAELLDRRRAVRGDRGARRRGCSRAGRAFGAFLHEAHHATKKDAPSGTALLLKRAMEQAGYTRPIDVSSTRAGFIPGTHTIGFDGPAETITLSHTARDRAAFARGALTAARWVKGRQRLVHDARRAWGLREICQVGRSQI